MDLYKKEEQLEEIGKLEDEKPLCRAEENTFNSTALPWLSIDEERRRLRNVREFEDEILEPTNSLNRTASWVIRNKETGEVIMETFDHKKIDALNTTKYEAAPIGDYLCSISKHEERVSSIATELGQKGGQVKSERKTVSSRENGRKGGRPNKIKLI